MVKTKKMRWAGNVEEKRRRGMHKVISGKGRR
jgi:hypothetical protein